MKVPYLDLRVQYTGIKDEIDRRIEAVIFYSDFVLGRTVDQFERAFASYCGVSDCVGVNNGTNALFLVFKALAIGPGDEVITAANSFIATAEAIAHTGATPVLVDVNPVTRTIDPDLLNKSLSKKTRAIVPVHLYGRMADLDPILEIAEERGIPVIEDAAQAHGALYNGRKAGSFGRAGTFSFYPGKNLGAFGDAGAVTTGDRQLADQLRRLRDHGARTRHKHEQIGYNARMNGIQAAVLDVKLKYLDKWNEQRRDIARHYHELLADCPVGLPTLEDDENQAFHIFAIEVPRRDDLQLFLSDHDVSTIVHYPVPIHLQPAFSCLGYKRGAFPVTERLAETVLSLPMYPEMTRDQVEYVSARVGEFYGCV